MDKEKVKKMVDIAKKYYLLEYSQQEIAEEHEISRPSVSRILQEAKADGIVQIEVIDPYLGVHELSEKLRERFKLKTCLIVNVPSNEDSMIKKYLGEKAAEYLREVVQDGDIIGTTWGTTIYEVARHLRPKNVNDVTIVQLNGGTSYSKTNTYAAEILSHLGKAFNSIPHFLPLPAVIDHPIVSEGILADRHIKHVLELGRKSNIALFTVGDSGENSTLINAGYFTDEDLHVLHKKEAVGDICSRFFDVDGVICNQELDSRTIGIDLREFRNKEHSILVAGGLHKVDGMIGALNGNYSDVLITDQLTAESLLEKTSE